jgi:hypothetical protein
MSADLRGRRLRYLRAGRPTFPNRRYFMRQVTALCAAAFHIIKWGGNDLCQVWDESVATKPWPDDYKTVSKPVATFDGAVAVKAHLLKKGVCKI